ncbi:HAD-IIA family hydrolase [Nesterenkonia alkaliphila]|uniref:HAD-IIA family hydrolase n=1 Tax=Nesterenkonia alkaliphila TaxID=1463631 RepID=A0A7K1UHT9_9MICC|nr:HAD-IIA family hydrolase [Nesterenkonia alkaliphila]MVT25952.1 HAD-IIA family hydrolase [Nesterenkonia alkaliphila]GFZ95758.1 acid sugar phosphatase [Nesterenkonia alkaliphila]
MNAALIESHDGVLFDLDGVLYRGAHAVPAAPQAVAQLKDMDRRCAFVTNNASRSAEQIAAHLVELGIAAEPHDVYGSATAGVALMSQHLAPPAKVLVTGSDSLRELCSEAGYTVVESASDSPEAVIQGFDPDLGWKDLAEASYAINNGAQWFATNLDRSVPRENGIAPANGALVEAVRFATGAQPLAAGKPEPVMFSQAAESLGLERPLVVGDRLDTDILGGNRAGYTTALVLTGATEENQAHTATGHQRPHWILDTLEDLFNGNHRSL